MFILIEGVDATGKTTIAKQLAENLGYINYQPILLRFRPLLGFIDKLSIKMRFRFYYFSNVITSFHIKYLLKHNNVILEQYVFSTAAFHSVLLNTQLRNQMLILPEKIVYLETDLNVIKKRLIQRNKITEYEGLGFLYHVDNEYKRLLSDFNTVTTVNTSTTTVKQASKKIMCKLNLSSVNNSKDNNQVRKLGMQLNMAVKH